MATRKTRRIQTKTALGQKYAFSAFVSAILMVRFSPDSRHSFTVKIPTVSWLMCHPWPWKPQIGPCICSGW